MTSSQSDNKQNDSRRSIEGLQGEETKHLLETLNRLQRENEILRRETLKHNRFPSNKIGFALLAAGAASLVGSVVGNHATLAFVGLGLVFWGVLFLFVRPVKFVKGSVLSSTVASTYRTIDRIVDDLNYSGKPTYVPPYPKEAYLPDYLRGLKEMVVFIPADKIVALPTIEEMAKKHFLLKNPKGLCITPPGYGLANLFERELRVEFTQINMERLLQSLPAVIVTNLELAKAVEMNLVDNFIKVKLVDSVYSELYTGGNELKSVQTIGCPLTSSIACAIAKASAKPLTIAKETVSADSKIIEVWYQTLEA